MLKDNEHNEHQSASIPINATCLKVKSDRPYGPEVLAQNLEFLHQELQFAAFALGL